VVKTGEKMRATRIDIRKHFAYKVVKTGEKMLIKVSNTSQLAAILTKYLACVNGTFGGGQN
jgi:hypothetical protein